ncbi:MAG: hypothetical protein COB09_18545 [Thalassobium sp.]|nr:MAG: hypothetical protein COB09_18545 [Thalassobium sp.]
MRADGNTNKQVASKLVLKEISGVPIGAQTGSTVAMVKTGNDEELAKNLFLAAVENMEVQESIRSVIYKMWDYTDAFEDAAYDIIWNITKYDDPTASFGEVLQSFGATIQDMKKSEEDFTALNKSGALRIRKFAKEVQELNKSTEAVPATIPKKDIEMSKTDDKVTDDGKKVLELTKQVAVLTALASMTDLHKSHYATLNDTNKAIFQEMETEGRDALVKAATSEDPVVFTNLEGIEFRKSCDPAMLAMAKNMDAMVTTNKALEASQLTSLYKSRVGVELSHVPGAEEHKVALLKAVDTISDVTVKNEVMKIVTAQNVGMKKAFNIEGVTTEKSVTDANDELDAMAKTHQDKHGVTFTVAYDAVLNTKEGEALYKQLA